MPDDAKLFRVRWEQSVFKLGLGLRVSVRDTNRIWVRTMTLLIVIVKASTE